MHCLVSDTACFLTHAAMLYHIILSAPTLTSPFCALLHAPALFVCVLFVAQDPPCSTI